MSWFAIGTSNQGTGHISLSMPCQDAHRIQAWDNSIVIAVADGLGSATKSDIGATIAVESGMAYLTKYLQHYRPNSIVEWQVVLRATFENALSHIMLEAEATGLPLRDFATTLAVALAHDGWFVSGQIGDGGVVALHTDYYLETYVAPMPSEYANVVVPLTSTSAMDLIQFRAEYREVCVIAVFTDGIVNICLVGPDDTPHIPFFGPMFVALSESENAATLTDKLAEFPNSDAVCRRTNDDKTLVMAVRQSCL